jgi:hypothetical protein
MLTICISAHSQAVEYNAIATAYVTTTISQNVVFNSTMQQGGTFTFSVLAHNGGGRAGQSDTANVKIEFYTAGGSLVTSANSTYNANLPNPNAVCGNPCIDTSVPWSTLTISKTLTSAEAANVTYARVSMYGIDGSFWAGDYGPWYRAPTFQLNGGGNLTYNPEFGPYNNVTAQGWTSSPGFGACQGAWGGSNACIVNSDGVPGTSTVGLVANANGGGPSATGGTTSGTPGGYNSTMSTTNAGTGATAGGAPPAPTVTNTTTSYTYRTVVSGNITRVYRTLVTTKTYSDNTTTSTNGNEELYSTATSTVVEVGTSNTQQGVVTTTTIEVVTNFFDGTQTTSRSTSSVTEPWPSYVTIGSGNVGAITFGNSSAPSLPQQTKIDAWTNKTVSDGNKIYIDQVSGNNNAVTIDQTGNKNVIKGQGTDYAKLQGNSNSITINQGVTGTGQNEVNFSVIGDSNTLNINQARTTQGSAIGTNGHYKAVDINGSNNTLTTQQSNTGGVGGHYMETTINGNQNNVTARQTDNGNKIMFNSIAGNNNTVESIQKGTGQHYLENKLTGNGNSVSAVQEGNIANRATLDLTNNGGPASVILQQNGGQNVSVTTSCATAGGCAPITVRQGY